MNKLSGRQILITRAEEDCESWADQLRLLGAVPIIFPCIKCEPIISKTILGKLEQEVPCAHWLVFTSRRGVDAFAALYERPLPEKLKIAVVGPTTAQAAGEKLGRVDFISEESTAISLGRELGKKIKSPCRLIMALAENAGKKLEGELNAVGKECVRLDLYRTIPKKSQRHRRKISSLGADSIFLASPSAGTGFTNQVELDATPNVFTIGPSTTASVLAAGLAVAGEAKQSNLQGLLEAFSCAN